MTLDALDMKIVRLLVTDPRAGAREFARRLGVARGTVQSRLARLERAGVVASYEPRIPPSALGFTVQAFVHVYTSLAKLDVAANALRDFPEVLEAYSVTGDADVICRIVASDNSELERVVQRILAVPGIVRTKTELALNERVAYRIMPLVELASRPAPRSTG
jgi:DNA-binding Lrp family transcriptional regulator